MKRTYLRGYVVRAEGDDDAEGKPLRIVAATAGKKADGLNLTMDNLDLDRFQANPVVGYGHMYWGRNSLPIGRADKTWVDDEKLMMDVSFDDDDEFARTVERKYRNRIMNAFSIGFSIDDLDEETGTPGSWELFEVSAVPLPMDPAAVVESGREFELARALAEVRAGAVLSKKNKQLVKNAITALSALLESAGNDDDGDDDGRQAESRLDKARRRLAGAR